MDTPKILIIVPSYKEEANIVRVLQGLEKYASGIDVLMIIDGSKDRTEEIVSFNDYNSVIHPFNMGYGVAIQTGYKYAVRNGYDLVVQIDGDGQHDPKYIKPMIDALLSSESDVVIGSRFLEGGSYDVPVSRKIGIKFFSKIASLITGQKISDSTSGFQALNHRAFYYFSKVDNFPYDYPDADTIITLIFAGFKVKEIPVIMYDRMNGKSMTTGLKTIVYVIKMLISILITVLRKKNICQDSEKLCCSSFTDKRIKSYITSGVKF
ncbi:MAG: glycosyltransferase family 2 protein [Candidatus Scalindua rubra]|uniref:Putative dolichyl-phosphate mannose synthase n=1 Tax=Candidatus Scalindua brodae TaxID=237368 RepID=A0A0B0ELD6_9BACT|nr:MAG: putative dolichyl-phosphate mannose synthase [Candidatus Scalindua brodae]MBZ0108291.1 glycosyltransferase family 2 protein [Candidatus Scalindua rubra]TWU33988.1 Undecaprenyl-phosphate mannosyltransferase [Candidatus Brocadiaceae bacterium S225]